MARNQAVLGGTGPGLLCCLGKARWWGTDSSAGRMGAGPLNGAGSWPGGELVQLTCSKITTPICTRKSKHKTPERGHSKLKAAANHLFHFFSLKLAATKNFQTLKYNTQLNIFVHL